MKNITQHLPNALTCGNLICGCLGIIYIFESKPIHATYLILLAGILDFLDGFVARLLHAHSAIGKELDSLADVVTFGVLPGFILYYLIGFDYNQQQFVFSNWCLFALLVPVFSAIRLAKFNVDTRQSEQFIGLPTPANAIFIASFPLLLSKEWFASFMISQTDWIPYFFVAIAVVFSLLLVAPLPLIAIKFKNFAWTQNKFRYLLIFSSLLFLLMLNTSAFPLIILNYILLSFIENIVVVKKV